MQGELRFGRLKSLRLDGDTNRIYVRKLTDEITAGAAGVVDFLYIGDTGRERRSEERGDAERSRV